MASPTSFGNEHRSTSLQVSSNTNSIFVTPPLYRSQQFTYDYTNTSCNVSLKFHFNSSQCQTNDNTIPSKVDFSTSLDPDAFASTVFQSDFVECTSAEIRESSTNMSYGTAKIPNRSTKNILDKETGQKILVMKRLLCSKQGNPILIFPLTNDTRRKNGVFRCGCLTSIKFKRIYRSDNWVTDSVNFDHNHPFTTPSKIRYLPINRSISHTSKLLFSSLAEVNVSISQQTAYFSNQLGGPQNMSCMTLDINNMVRDDRIDLKNYDVDLIVEEFEMKKLKNRNFFYDLVKDDQGRLKHLF
ncbi:hypothetical protein ZOSMA_114G00060 [Zostera marina]|uniref:Uncharacterized protein n=1 Tax=Zostera marina TaxID=29655 RepID=A0A0K9Q2I3_ZOSMR|nr:hypothetical protein ZOSMA_114G00060 [Zostera marina]